MEKKARITASTRAVLQVFLAEPARDRYGLDLCAAAELPSGTVYPILARLEGLGWVESRWEEPGVHVQEGRPRRRYYRITPDGAERAREAISRAYRSRRQPEPGWLSRPGTAGGAP